MSFPVIVLGDKTSHGGMVINASPFSDTHGKGWARKGDMVSCPLCKGVFPIIQGDPSLTDDGNPVAYHDVKWPAVRRLYPVRSSPLLCHQVVRHLGTAMGQWRKQLVL